MSSANNNFMDLFNASYANLQRVNNQVTADDASRQNFSTTIIPQLTNINTNIKTLAVKIKALKTELDNSKSAVANNTSQLSSKQTELDNLNAQITQLQADKASISSKYDALENASKAQVSAHQSAINSYETQIQQLQKTNNELQDQANKLSQSLGNTGSASLVSSVAAIKQEIQQNSALINALQAEIQRRDQQIDALDQQIQSITQSSSNAQSQTAQQIAAMQTHANDLNNQISNLTTQNAALKQTIVRATTIIDEATANLERLNSESMNDQSLQQINTIISQIDQTIQEINTLLDTNPPASSSIANPPGAQSNLQSILPGSTLIPVGFNNTEITLNNLNILLQKLDQDIPTNAVSARITRHFVMLLNDIIQVSDFPQVIATVFSGLGLKMTDNSNTDITISGLQNLTSGADLLSNITLDNQSPFQTVFILNLVNNALNNLISGSYNDSTCNSLVKFFKDIEFAQSFDKIEEIYEASPFKIIVNNNPGQPPSLELRLKSNNNKLSTYPEVDRINNNIGRINPSASSQPPANNSTTPPQPQPNPNTATNTNASAPASQRSNITELPDNTKIQISNTEVNLGDLYNIANNQYQSGGTPANSPSSDALQVFLLVLGQSSQISYITNIIKYFGIGLNNQQITFDQFDILPARTFSLVDVITPQQFNYFELFTAAKNELETIVQSQNNDNKFYNISTFISLLLRAQTVSDILTVYN